MKRVITFGLLVAVIALYSCNSNKEDAGQSYEGFVSNAVRTPTTLDGKPIPKQTASTGESATAKPAIDVTASSDSKGVGPFADKEVKLGSLDGSMASKGKELFQTYCTACHTPTDQRLVGPGLKGITKIRTPQWILNMITNPIEMTKSDPVAKQLKADFNNVQMTDMGLSDEDARAVLEFLRQNDGVN